jgi:hypothetical protein
MKIFRLHCLALFAVTMLLMACVHQRNSANKPSAAVSLTTARGQLDIGYSLLYQEANGTPKMNLVLLFKEKSAEANKMVDNTMTFYRNLAVSLEHLVEQYPGVRIDLAPMSEIEGDTRKAIGLDQLKDFAPLFGKSGIGFERELLLMFYNALDEQRHLVGVMIERETDPDLKTYLNKTEDQLDAQRRKIGSLLDRKYFTH